MCSLRKLAPLYPIPCVVGWSLGDCTAQLIARVLFPGSITRFSLNHDQRLSTHRNSVHITSECSCTSSIKVPLRAATLSPRSQAPHSPGVSSLLGQNAQQRGRGVNAFEIVYHSVVIFFFRYTSMTQTRGGDCLCLTSLRRQHRCYR